MPMQGPVVVAAICARWCCPGTSSSPFSPGNLAGKPGGEELGVEVMGDHIEPCAEQALEILHRILQVSRVAGFRTLPTCGEVMVNPPL